MSVVAMTALGCLTGLHAATWGGYKDSPFEGFSRRSFFRSIGLGATVGAAVAETTELDSTESVVVLIGLLYAAERLSTEWWKSFVREDPQTSYTIPMRIAVRGQPVDARLPRYAVGAAVAVGLVAVLLAVHTSTPPAAPLWSCVLVGGASGWFIAAGGAWKDAPIEGFSGWKFLRSPVVATGWVCLLLPATRDWLLLAVAGGALSVLSIETYKTFLTGDRPPGKFADRPVRFRAAATQQTCRVLHSGVYLLLACCMWFPLGRPGVWTGADRGPLTSVTAAVLASALCLVVAARATPGPVMLGGRIRSADHSEAAAREPGADDVVRGEDT